MKNRGDGVNDDQRDPEYRGGLQKVRNETEEGTDRDIGKFRFFQITRFLGHLLVIVVETRMEGPVGSVSTAKTMIRFVRWKEANCGPCSGHRFDNFPISFPFMLKIILTWK